MYVLTSLKRRQFPQPAVDQGSSRRAANQQDSVDITRTLVRVSEGFRDTIEGGFDQRPDHLFILFSGNLNIEVQGLPVIAHQRFFPHPDVGLETQLLLGFLGSPP